MTQPKQGRSVRFTRRQSLGVLAGASAGAFLAKAPAVHAQTLSGKVTLATWPNYHNMANLDAFSEAFGVEVAVATFGSNEEMMAKMQAGSAGFDVVVPSNYAIEPYAKLGLIRPLDLSLIPNYDPSVLNPAFVEVATVDGDLYAIHKNWGTTGFIYNTDFVDERPTTLREFFELLNGSQAGAGLLLDHQLSTLGSALVAVGRDFNSTDPADLEAARELLVRTKPNLFGITSSPQPPIRSGDATLALCWNFDARQLRRDMPSIEYVVPADGGEVWSDFYVVAGDGPNPEAAHALINYLLDPEVNLREFEAHGSAIADTRVEAMLPEDVRSDPVLYPSDEQLAVLSFASAEALTDPGRNEVMSQFKAA